MRRAMQLDRTEALPVKTIHRSGLVYSARYRSSVPHREFADARSFWRHIPPHWRMSILMRIAPEVSATLQYHERLPKPCAS